jgi:hypothetical protein
MGVHFATAYSASIDEAMRLLSHADDGTVKTQTKLKILREYIGSGTDKSMSVSSSTEDYRDRAVSARESK